MAICRNCHEIVCWNGERWRHKAVTNCKEADALMDKVSVWTKNGWSTYDPEAEIAAWERGEASKVVGSRPKFRKEDLL